MGRSKSRKQKAAKAPTKIVVPQSALDDDRFGVIMDWMLCYVTILDSARPSLSQMFAMVEYLGSRYTMSDMSRVIIFRELRRLYAARVAKSGELCEFVQVIPDGSLSDRWDNVVFPWDPELSIVDNLTNIRIMRGALS